MAVPAHLSRSAARTVPAGCGSPSVWRGHILTTIQPYLKHDPETGSRFSDKIMPGTTERKGSLAVTIDVRNIVKRFGDFRALDNVDLRVESGELLALLGPSGSGKTTLLRIIAGLDWPDAGSISFDGEDALARSAGERNVGFVFQHYALFRHMNVFENVAFGLRVQPRAIRKNEAGIRKRVHDLLDLVQLRPLADRVVVMDKGRIEQIGTPEEIYDRPQTAFVHSFIGESIVLPVTVADGGVRLGDRVLNIAADGAASGASRLFIRRHDVTLVPPGGGELEGAVRRVRAFGPVQRADVALRTPGAETMIEIDAPRDNEIKVGDVVALKPKRYRIFADRA